MHNAMNLAYEPHDEIYSALQSVRETFHREGRISDANAKLDETVKLLAIHYGYLIGLVDATEYARLKDRRTFSARCLNSIFVQLAKEPIFSRRGMGSIFGSAPTTIFEEGDETIAHELFVAAGQAFEAQTSDKHRLDILNEAYGHHVRDNFRNHVEDAQYMTPPEVVDFMVSVALNLVPKPKIDRLSDFIVADPSCGVGSFLTSWRRICIDVHGLEESQRLRCIGQDKVDRMVRLTAINMIFSDCPNDDVFLGNAIHDDSPLSKYNGQVDLILTNPPFGARFATESLQKTSQFNTPFFANISSKTRAIDSEFLFIDRYLTLLKPEGLCFVIVPDGVVSAKGTASILRQHLTRNAELIAVIELPSVTFAQAGTRTKTAILGFRKTNSPRQSYPVFFSEVDELGYKVSKRKGVPLKRPEGKNELPCVANAFKDSIKTFYVAEKSINAAWCDLEPGKVDTWTPRRMIFGQEILKRQVRHDLISLRDLTEVPRKRKSSIHSKDTFFISVLHIIGEGILDIPGIKSYEPITPGLPVEPGEVILSRINPRIPRAAVVPDLGRKLLCSSEFEILRPTSQISPYTLVFLLLCPFVQGQIQSLTAGTSSSHSRVKPRQVYDVLLPDLVSLNYREYKVNLSQYEESCKKITECLIEIEKFRQSLDIDNILEYKNRINRSVNKAEC